MALRVANCFIWSDLYFLLALDEMNIDCFAESSDRWVFDYLSDRKRNIETPVNTALDPKEGQRTESNVKKRQIRVGVLVPFTHFLSHVIQKTCL